VGEGERRRGFGEGGGDGRVRFGVGRDPVRTRGVGLNGVRDRRVERWSGHEGKVMEDLDMGKRRLRYIRRRVSYAH